MFEMTQVATIETLGIRIPDSLALFAFAVTLVVAAVLTRWLLARGDAARSGEVEGLTER